MYSRSTGTLFMFPSVVTVPYAVSGMPCELDMAWHYNTTSGELTQTNSGSWGPLGLSSCAKSAVGKPGTVLGIAGLDSCPQSSFQWKFTEGRLMHV